jgi:putative toxin-antitoxin system antitoxin component (TIGR02293 family)
MLQINDWAARDRPVPSVRIALTAASTVSPRDDFEAWIAEDISRLAERVFGNQQNAFKWLHQPNLATDNKAPIELLGTLEGFKRVENLLLRIDYGVLA